MGWSPLPACPTLPRLPSPAWEGEEHHCCDQRIIFTTSLTSKQPSTHIKQMTIFARRGSGSYKGAYESDDDIAAKGQNNGWAMLSSFLLSHFVPSLHFIELWLVIYIKKDTLQAIWLPTFAKQGAILSWGLDLFVWRVQTSAFALLPCKDKQHQLILLL